MKQKKSTPSAKPKKCKSKELIQQEKNNKYKLGRLIVALRKGFNNMSREVLSELSGIAIDTLIKIERGVQMLGADKLKLIAIVFSVSTDSLYDVMSFKYLV